MFPWLLRQLQNAPDTLKVEARLPRADSVAALLSEVRQTPEAIYPDQGKEIRQFVVTLTTNMGQKRAVGRGAFIDSVLDTTKTFYGDVLQSLRAWKGVSSKAEEAPA